MFFRAYQESDVPDILRIYKEAFAGSPWFLKLTGVILEDRWRSDSSQPDFKCIVAQTDGSIVGTIWWNTITSEMIERERGASLREFVVRRFPHTTLIWERDIMVAPAHQGRGIATTLRESFFATIQSFSPLIVLTRMRDDNPAVIKIAKKLEFQQTGIKIPCSLKPGIHHEYWYRPFLETQ